MALAGAVHHAVMHSPAGAGLATCKDSFIQSSMQMGVSMATWSIVSTIVEPIVGRYMENGFWKSVVNSAATGAITEIRNGPSGMLGGSLTGVAQSLFLAAVQKGIVFVGRPVFDYRRTRAIEKFHKERNECVFSEPLEVLSSAFGW